MGTRKGHLLCGTMAWVSSRNTRTGYSGSFNGCILRHSLRDGYRVGHCAAHHRAARRADVGEGERDKGAAFYFSLPKHPDAALAKV
jgi:hypothetical protein